MRIEDLKIEPIASGTEVSALLGERRLWFRLPGEMGPASPGDAFLLAGLIPAMTEGGRFELSDDFRVSPKLHAALPKLQDILVAWSTGLQHVDVVARVGIREPGESHCPPEGVASTFSGGVDSLYTMLRHKERITHLIHIDGFEFAAGAPEFAAVSSDLEKLAGRHEKQLLTVATNAVLLAREMKIGRDLYYGSCLASVAHLLGFKEVFIPSSHDYRDLQPSSSNPLIDLIWVSEHVSLLHDGCEASRYEKVAYLVEHHPETLRKLKVCWYRHDVNCCRCNKCLRTMVALELLGFDSPSFPEPLRPGTIRRARFEGATGLTNFAETLEIARESGRTSLVRAMALAHANTDLPAALKSTLWALDDVLLGGRLGRRHSRWRARKDAARDNWFNVRSK